MDKSSRKIEESESKIAQLILSEEITDEAAQRIGDLLGRILSSYFSTLNRDTGMRGWSVDDMYPTEIRSGNNKITLSGDIHWLSGGDICKHFQADIAKDLDPMLYSVKLKTNKLNQVVYIGKTKNGWILNAA